MIATTQSRIIYLTHNCTGIFLFLGLQCFLAFTSMNMCNLSDKLSQLVVFKTPAHCCKLDITISLKEIFVNSYIGLCSLIQRYIFPRVSFAEMEISICDIVRFHFWESLTHMWIFCNQKHCTLYYKDRFYDNNPEAEMI